jgi:hypothetical protein
MYQMNKIITVGLLVCAETVFSACENRPATETQVGEWTIYSLSNTSVSLEIAPRVGGRILQYKLGGHGFFFVNAGQLGKPVPSTTLGQVGTWGNQGGAKLWPAPQGWDGPAQWPGPPDPVLDGGAYTVLDRSDYSITIQSSDDKEYTGIRFMQKISLDSIGSGVAFEVTMKNISEKQIRWGIWSHVQLDASLPGSGDFNHLRMFCPLNPDSRFEKGYDVIFGEKENPSYRINTDSSRFEAEYLYQVGKAGIDSPGDWAATLNPQTGDVFVQKFTFAHDLEYPEHASVEVWTNGVGSYHAYGQDMVSANDPEQNPYVFESEILSPYAALQPQEEYQWHFRWFSCNIGTGETQISDCTEAGVLTDKPQLVLYAQDVRQQNTRLTGTFGVFYPGQLVLTALNREGKTLSESIIRESITPLQPVCIRNRQIKVPVETSVVKLVIRNPAFSSEKTLAFIELTVEQE